MKQIRRINCVRLHTIAILTQAWANWVKVASSSFSCIAFNSFRARSTRSIWRNICTFIAELKTNGVMTWNFEFFPNFTRLCSTSFKQHSKIAIVLGALAKKINSNWLPLQSHALYPSARTVSYSAVFVCWERKPGAQSPLHSATHKGLLYWLTEWKGW